MFTPIFSHITYFTYLTNVENLPYMYPLPIIETSV